MQTIRHHATGEQYPAWAARYLDEIDREEAFDRQVLARDIARWRAEHLPGMRSLYRGYVRNRIKHIRAHQYARQTYRVQS